MLQSLFAVDVSSDRMALHWMASHSRQLVRYRAGAVMLLLALAVIAATPVRRSRPNGPRSRVIRSIPRTEQAHEAIEPRWITARANDHFVSTPDPMAAGFLSYPLRPTGSDTVVDCFLTVEPRLTVFALSPPRGPPLVVHSLI
jgi:hypothetical protein